MRLEFLRSSANIRGENKDEVVEYLHDTQHYWNLIPNISQATNVFFREATMKMKDKWWDIFEFFEYEVNLFEKSRT